MSDKFWSEDPSVLFDSSKIAEFFPRKEGSTEERLNSIARFSLYTSLVVCLYHRNVKFLYIGIMGLILTYILHFNVKPTAEEFTDIRVRPTLNNPFMNVSQADYVDNPDRPAAQSYAGNDADSQEIKKDIDEKFDYNLYHDVSEIYGNMNSQRQFITNPSTTIPNDRKSFQEWLYGDAKSCHDNNMNCLKYEDVRQKSQYFEK